MAGYRIIEPTQEKFDQLATLAFKYRKWERLWHAHYGADNKKELVKAEKKLDEWFEENLAPIENLGDKIDYTK